MWLLIFTYVYSMGFRVIRKGNSGCVYGCASREFKRGRKAHPQVGGRDTWLPRPLSFISLLSWLWMQVVLWTCRPYFMSHEGLIVPSTCEPIENLPSWLRALQTECQTHSAFAFMTSKHETDPGFNTEHWRMGVEVEGWEVCVWGCLPSLIIFIQYFITVTKL